MAKSIVFFLMLFITKLVVANNTSDSLVKEIPIVLQTPTGSIYGTLATPTAYKKIPVALIVAGSGPTDRNGNNPMMKNDAYRMIAMALALQGIATVRYDKRGIAESAPAMKGEIELRFDDYVNDAKKWVGFLKEDKRFSEIIIVGHSEGSLIGMLACETGVNKFVSIAGAGRPADVILKEQLSAQPAAVKDAAFPVIDSLKNGMPVKNVAPFLFSLFRPSVQPYMMSWFKNDPAKVIEGLKLPVLILQGTNDLQVKVEDAEILHRANPSSELVILENVNHVLKKVANSEENLKAYSDPTIPVDEKLINVLVNFMLQKK